MSTWSLTPASPRQSKALEMVCQPEQGCTVKGYRRSHTASLIIAEPANLLNTSFDAPSPP